MKYEYRGRNIDINENLKALSEKKLARLSKFFTDDTTVYITYRAENKKVLAEITIPMQGTTPIRGEAGADDKLTALETALDRLEKQLVRYRKRMVTKAKTNRNIKTAYLEAPSEEPEEEMMEIRRIKRISVKPMDVSEACLEMELLGHDFFAFRNKDTDAVNIVYKRKEAGTYGLLEIEE